MIVSFLSLSIKSFFADFTHTPTFLKKSGTKNFYGKTGVFSDKINLFSETLVSYSSLLNSFKKELRD